MRKTITSIFMVPTLKIPKDDLAENNFINGYIKDPNHEVDYMDAVYLLFKPESLNRFRRFLDSEYERTKAIIEDYDYDEGYVVIVYKLDPDFKKDFELVKKGKYSKTSAKFQKLFPIVVKITRGGLYKDELSLQCRIFKKTDDLVKFWEKEFDVSFGEDQEVWRGFNEEEETLDIDKVKNYVE